MRRSLLTATGSHGARAGPFRAPRWLITVTAAIIIITRPGRTPTMRTGHSMSGNAYGPRVGAAQRWWLGGSSPRERRVGDVVSAVYRVRELKRSQKRAHPR